MTKPRGGPSRKPPGVAVDQRNGQRIVLARPGTPHPLPSSITDSRAIQIWNTFWEDPVSSLIGKADRPTLDRWIDLVQSYWRLRDLVEHAEMVESAQGSPLANPLIGSMISVEQAIERLEAKFGMGPKNRAALGIAIVKLDQANERPDPTPVPDPEDEPDPRMGAR